MTQELKPGDLCEVIDGPRFEFGREFIGQLVTLVRISPGCRNRELPFANKTCPHWEVEETGSIVFGYQILRKLPPPQILCKLLWDQTREVENV